MNTNICIFQDRNAKVYFTSLQKVQQLHIDGIVQFKGKEQNNDNIKYLLIEKNKMKIIKQFERINEFIDDYLDQQKNILIIDNEDIYMDAIMLSLFIYKGLSFQNTIKLYNLERPDRKLDEYYEYLQEYETFFKQSNQESTLSMLNNQLSEITLNNEQQQKYCETLNSELLSIPVFSQQLINIDNNNNKQQLLDGSHQFESKIIILDDQYSQILNESSIQKPYTQIQSNQHKR